MAQSDNITATNRMSAKQLIVSQNAALQFVNNPKTNKIFFVCGKVRGYVSPAAQKLVDTGKLEDFQYAEVSVDGKPAVPCLMAVGNSKANVKRELGEELLH